MKKLYVVVLMFLCLILSSCSSKTKIVYLRDLSHRSLVEDSFIKGIESLDYKIEVVDINNDDEFNLYINKINKRSNKNKLFIISGGFSDLDISSNNFRYIYLNSPDSSKSNNINIDTKDVSYILGIIGGVITRENNVSVVLCDSYSDYTYNLDAFMEGLKKVNPRAFDDLEPSNIIVSNNNDDISELISNIKSDVLFNFTDHHIIDESKIVLTTYTDDESFVEVSYDYSDMIRNIIDQGKDSYIMSLREGNISLKLDGLDENLKEVITSYIK